MRSVIWSEDALQDFDNAILYIAKEDKSAATLVADRIEDAAALLAESAIGRPGRVAGTYEKSVLKTPFILAYGLSDNTLTIVHVIHTSREWLEGEWPKDRP